MKNEFSLFSFLSNCFLKAPLTVFLTCLNTCQALTYIYTVCLYYRLGSNSHTPNSSHIVHPSKKTLFIDFNPEWLYLLVTTIRSEWCMNVSDTLPLKAVLL